MSEQITNIELIQIIVTRSIAIIGYVSSRVSARGHKFGLLMGNLEPCPLSLAPSVKFMSGISSTSIQAAIPQKAMRTVYIKLSAPSLALNPFAEMYSVCSLAKSGLAPPKFLPTKV
jgi:hypothetical protein